jgi:hypothetical protein
MPALPNWDCTDFNRAVSPELLADLGRVLDLALHSPKAPEIVPVMQRVARAVAAERLRPEEMIVCVKGLWLGRHDSMGAVGLDTHGTWLGLVRTMIETYYIAVDARTETGDPPPG